MLTSNGLALATALACLAAILGLIVGSIALTSLIRRGYGPFLRSLLRGKRKTKRRDGTGRRSEIRSHRPLPPAARAPRRSRGYEQDWY